MPVPFNDLYAQYTSIKAEIDSAIENVIKRSAFIKGSDVSEFENAFADYCGVAATVGVGNGTDALMLSLSALGIGPGDEVIVPAQSFIATIEPIITLGAKPVFVDISTDTYTLNPALIEKAITPATKCIIAVHLFGHLADMQSIMHIAKTHQLFVIEDAAQAHGATQNNQRAGSFGDLATFSFYPGKNLGAFGDAGAVTTNNLELSRKILKLRDHGRASTDKFGHTIVGYNSRLDTLQAAILSVKLRYLDQWTSARQKLASHYTQYLSEELRLPHAADYCSHVYHLYVVCHAQRDWLRDCLLEKQIHTGIHYPQALHQHPAIIEHLGNLEGRFPQAEELAKQCLSLPIYPEMSLTQLDFVIDQIELALNNASILERSSS